MASRGSSIDDIVAQLDRERATQRLYACFSDLSHLQRTGRIGKAKAMIGSLMKIVPVLALKNGEVGAEATVRTFSRAQETMLDLVMKVVTEPSKARFLVTHTKAPALAETAAEKLRARLAGVEPAALGHLGGRPGDRDPRGVRARLGFRRARVRESTGKGGRHGRNHHHRQHLRYDTAQAREHGVEVVPIWIPLGLNGCATGLRTRARTFTSAWRQPRTAAN